MKSASYHLEGPQPLELVDYRETVSAGGGERRFTGHIRRDGQARHVSGAGNGLLSSVLAALRDDCGLDLDIRDYQEHAIGHCGDAQAAAYVACRLPDDRTRFGAGLDTDVATASLKSLLSVANAVSGSPGPLQPRVAVRRETARTG